MVSQCSFRLNAQFFQVPWKKLAADKTRKNDNCVDSLMCRPQKEAFVIGQFSHEEESPGPICLGPRLSWCPFLQDSIVRDPFVRDPMVRDPFFILPICPGPNRPVPICPGVNARSLIYSPRHGLELSSPKFTLNEVKYVEVIVQGALDLACS